MKKIIFLFAIVFLIVFCIYIYKKHSNEIGFPIDIVYLWVDGSDEQWQKKKNYWQKELGITEEYAVSEARYRDREELKHSLRSVEQYMPWVRKIFIVTDNQVPEWLNLNHPKIKIVDHKDILPADALPVFNSTAIETGIVNIEGLAEHFIYLNDDVFVNKPITPDYFFTKEGKPIFYNDSNEYKIRKRAAARNPNEMWVQRDKNLENLIKSRKIEFHDLLDTHTAHIYCKEDLLNAMDLFKDEINKTSHSKFRNLQDLNICFVYEILYNQRKISVRDSWLIYEKCPFGILVMMNTEDIDKLNPYFFCLNDTHDLPLEYVKKHTEILREKFPKKSSFEK